MTVGERIRERRIELHLTQDQLAEKMGYKSKSAICRVEKDYEQNLTLDRVALFAKALNTTAEQLMGWNSQEDNSNKETLIDDYISKLKSEEKTALIYAYLSQLNEEGFEEAMKRIQELTELNKYKKED